MIPGVGKAIKDVDIDEDAFKSIEAVIRWMTEKERAHTDIIDASRRRSIAAGSGTSLQEVNRILKNFEDMRKIMKSAMNMKANPMKMMRNMRRR